VTDRKSTERQSITLESLLPEPQKALERLMEKQRERGVNLEAHWSLSARDRGSNTTEIAFTPTAEAGASPGLLASGGSGAARVEVELGLAHANPDEEARFRRTMARRQKFTMLVLSHEEGAD